MTRLKWVEISTSFPLKSVPSLLQEKKYIPEINFCGFELLEISRSAVTAKFIQEFKLSDVQIDPFGKEVSSTITRYSTTIFTILEINGRKLMRIAQPPRTLRDLVLNISSALDGDFFAQEIRIDVIKFLDYFKGKVQLGHARVRSALFVDVPLTESSTGRVLVDSSRDAIFDFNKCLKGGRLDKVTLELVNEFGISPLEITYRGSLVHDEWLDDSTLHELESHIAFQLNKNGSLE